MKRIFLAGLAIIFFMFAMVGASQATIIQDQANLGQAISHGVVESTVTWIQTITTDLTGELSNVEVFLTDYDGTPQSENITAEIYIGGILQGSDSVFYSENGSSSILFDFSIDNLSMNAGDVFELWLTGSDSTWNFAFDLSDNNYSGELNVISSGSLMDYSFYDLRFITYVDNGTSAVPEPSTILLFSFGLVGITGLARKRIKK